MNLQKALLFADEIVFKETGRHLDDIQLGLIEGVLQRKKYGEIAKELKCTEGYIKDVGYELWRLFSIVFREDVNKSNFRSSILRHGSNDNTTPFNVFGSGESFEFTDIHLAQDGFDAHQSRQIMYKKDVIRRLRKTGLNAQQVAECLEIALEDVIRHEEA